MIRIGLLAGFLAFAAAPAAADEEEVARYVDSLSDQTLALLGEDIPEDERLEGFRALIDRHLATEALAPALLGPVWERAAPEEQEAFRDAFEESMIAQFAPMFEQDVDVEVAVRDVEPRDPRGYNAELDLEGIHGIPTVAVHVIETNDSRYQVADVTFGGIRMFYVLRQEYRAYLNRHGGDIMALVEELRDRTDLPSN